MKRLLSAGALLFLLAGCATTQGDTDPRDPFEGFNRTVFRFNDAVDEAVLKPVATGYQKVTPSFVQTGVSNFFGNIGDVWSAVNSLLQGEVETGLSSGMRVAVNTTFGFLGVLDIASEAGLVKHKEDFGQTLGVWGMPSGPYLVLPLLGPSTIRDTAALPADIWGDVWQHTDPVSARNAGTVLRIVDTRASLLDAGNLLEDVALDKYAFTRDAWLQRRQSQIGGESSRPAYYDEFDEEDLELDAQETQPAPAQ